jgi:biopolymer transport protein ExbD
MFFQGKPKKSDDNLHDINMTPLIDVSLVLVVMLLLATPLAFESSIGVKKAANSANTAEKQKVEERVELHVLTDDTIKVNRRVVNREDLSKTLLPLMQASVDRLVVIDCDGGVSHGVFVDVLDQTKLCGAKEIAVTGK